MNSVHIMGRICKDLEVKTGASGTEFLSFSVAVNRKFSKEKETDFINCKAFGKTAVNIAKFFTKGSLILIEGRIQTGSYEKDGHRVYTTDVMVDGFHFTGEKKKDDAGFEPVEENSELPF